MKRQIEIFTAGCPVCDPTVKLVQELACQDCEITIYDVVKQCKDKTCLTKVKAYGIKKLPAVAVEGKLLSCCSGEAVTKSELISAGVGKTK
ncbi:MAG: thioredoxin family protein [Chitinophagaceae bacterium]